MLIRFPGSTSIAPSAKDKLSGSLPPAPSTNREAWQLLKKHAVTLPGAAVMADSTISRMIHAIPAVIVPQLAPRCVTPAARIGLLAAGLALPMVLRPIRSVFGGASLDLFCARFMKAEEKALTDRMAGQARLWKAPKVAANVQQQLLSGNHQLACQVAATLGQAVRLAVDIGLGVVTFTSGAFASPTLMAVVIGLQVYPVVMQMLFRAARVSVAGRVTAAERKYQEHLARYWDNVLIGPPEARTLWQAGYSHNIDEMRRARFKCSIVNQAISLVEDFPANLQSIAQGLPYFSTRVLGESYKLISDDTMNRFIGLHFGVSSLTSASYLASSFNSISQMLQNRKDMQLDIEACPPLTTMIQVDNMTMRRDGTSLESAAVLKNLDILLQPGHTTLRAPNGSGKTAFMSQCRQHFGDKSLFVPAAHTLDFGLEKGSTGQTVMRILRHIDAMERLPAILLLDEWDANLDSTNQAIAQAMIERWSKTTSVVDVRNRD